MCCEATDALLEYVRRYLGLTGLRNLNAPRRLKLRVPVLKEWLQRQGQHGLATSIPDWDPVRRPTGRWKSWEMAHLKPIMDEKAVERQAKRNLVSGEANQLREMRERVANDNKQDAIDALMAVAGAPGSEVVAVAHDDVAEPPHPLAPYAPPSHPTLDAASRPVEGANGGQHAIKDEYADVVEDDAGEEGEEGSQYDVENVNTAAEAATAALGQIAAVRRLLLRCEPSPENDIQNLALYNCIQAVDHLTRQLSDGSQYLSACTLAPLAVHSSQDSHAGGAAPVVMWPPVSSQDGVKRDVGGVGAGEHVSSQEEAALLLGASQVSLTGFDVMNHSQESQVEQTSDDSASPRAADHGAAADEEGGAAGAEPSAKRRKVGAEELGAKVEAEENVAEVNASPPEPLASCESQDRALNDLMEHAIEA